MYYIDDYEIYLKEKNVSSSTVTAYLADVDAFEEFLKSKGIKTEKAKESDCSEYFESLKLLNKGASTINRKISAARSYYDYLIQRGAVKHNPFYGIKALKLPERDVIYLSRDEMALLLSLQDNSPAGKRDKAMLLLMYTSGLRVTEICNLDIQDLNLSIGYVSIKNENKGKSRIVPLSKDCREAVREYIINARRVLLGKKDDKSALFLSYLGERITRQGVWKAIRKYGESTPFAEKISPQVFRNSFAVRLVECGADLKSLQELLGNEDIMAAKIFLSFSKNRIMDVYEKAFPRT